MKIINAKFITSAVSIKDSIFEGISEIAILGRSNVGKSSFINAITNNKNLAKSSSTPGKTKLINFFSITFLDDEKNTFEARLVDLPGFGYAKVSKTEKKVWEQNLTSFIQKRNSIKLFIHLIDARHPNLPLDKEVESFLESIKKPDQKILKIFTKADKLNQKEKSQLLKYHQNPILVSNLKKSGINKAIEAIYKGVYE